MRITLVLVAVLFHLVASVPFVAIQQGVAEQGSLAAAASILYYKIDFTSEPQGSTVRILLSSCMNAVNVFGKICDPNTSGGTCLDDNFIPSPQNNEFSFLFDPASEKNAAGELPLTGNFFCPQQATCSTQRVYYLAIVPATVPAMVHIYARSYRPNEAAPLAIANDNKLSFEPHSGVLSWNALATCKEVDEKATCKSMENVPNTRYRVIYASMNETANVGSICSTRYASGVLEWTTNTVVTLPFFGEREYSYRIGVYADSLSYPLEAQFSYAPIVAIKKQHSDAGNIALQVIMIIAFILLALFMLVSAAAVIVIAAFYIRKSQSAYEVVN